MVLYSRFNVFKLAVLILHRHITDECAECGELVSVGDVELRVALVSLVPGEIVITIPGRLRGNECNLGEGCHVKGNVTGSGIVLEGVVRRCLAVCDHSHCNGRSVLYVVEAEVTEVKTLGKELLDLDLDRNGVVGSNACNVHVVGLSLLVVCESDVSAAGGHSVHVKSSIGCAALKLSACRKVNVDGALTVAHLCICGECTVRAKLYGNGCGAFLGSEVGPYKTLVIVAAEAVGLIVPLCRIEVDVEGSADGGVLILVARGLLHMQGYAYHDLTAVVLYAAFRRREEDAGCDRAVR